jgi:hypothetical protein
VTTEQRRRVSVRTRLSVRLLPLGLTVAVLSCCLLRPSPTLPGADFNQGTNAAWLGVEWVNTARSQGEIESLVGDLSLHQIRYIFVYATYLRADGEFNPTYEHATSFLHQVKATSTDLHVQAWIGLPLVHVDLANSEVRARIVALAVELVEAYGFDGVHLDPEPVTSGDGDLLALLDEIRDALPGSSLSVASRRIWPFEVGDDWSITGRYCWHPSYYKQVAERVDQVAVMAYDSALPCSSLYRQWGHLQTVALTRALDHSGVKLFIGIPVSDEWTWTHWPSGENVTSGLGGLVDGLNDPDAVPGVLTGVALYPYWEMDGAKWAVYEDLWLGEVDAGNQR